MFDEQQRRLLYLLHKGLVEIRSLSFENDETITKQIYDLADILEVIPCYMVNWSDECHKLIVGQLEKYKEKYLHSKYDFLGMYLEYSLEGSFDNP